jgi:DNA polymerase theta
MESNLIALLNEALLPYKSNGITQLADYQRDILQDPRFYPPISRNLLFTSPTGSGKSLVAEVLASINVRLSSKKCMFILPYIAPAQEVFLNLQVILCSLF